MMQTNSSLDKPKTKDSTGAMTGKTKLRETSSPTEKPNMTGIGTLQMPKILYTSNPIEGASLAGSFLNVTNMSEISLTESLEAMSDAELLRTVQNMQRDFNLLNAENECLHKFLMRVNPNIFANPSHYIGSQAAIVTAAENVRDSGLETEQESTEITPEQTIDAVEEQPVEEVESSSEKKVITPSELATSIESESSHHISESIAPHISFSALENAPKINTAHKTELIDKETEELKNVKADFVAKSEMKAATLKAQIEEIDIRTVETREARDQFEKIVVVDGLDPVTQRIPAEKFIHYMEDWLKRVGQAIEKLRLRTGTMRSQYTRLHHQFALKEELGESLRPIDFEQLTIENKDHSNTIEDKNVHLLGLKRVTGIASLTLSVQKKNLIEAMQNLKEVEVSILASKGLIKDMEKEEVEAENEAIVASEELEKLKEITRDYSAPGVMEYVKIKAELYKLEDQMKTWMRKRSVQEIALNSCSKQYKQCMTYCNLLNN